MKRYKILQGDHPQNFQIFPSDLSFKLSVMFAYLIPPCILCCEPTDCSSITCTYMPNGLCRRGVPKPTPQITCTFKGESLLLFLPAHPSCHSQYTICTPIYLNTYPVVVASFVVSLSAGQTRCLAARLFRSSAAARAVRRPAGSFLCGSERGVVLNAVVCGSAAGSQNR